MLLELEIEVMGWNWAVGLPGHFAGLLPACIYLAERPFLLILFDFLFESLGLNVLISVTTKRHSAFRLLLA